MRVEGAMREDDDEPAGHVSLPDYGNKYRIPFKLVGGAVDERGTSTNIVSVDPEENYGMSVSLAQLIQQHSACIGCGRPPFPVERHARCKRDSSSVEDTRFRRFEEDGRRRWIESSTAYVSLCQVIFQTSKEQLIDQEHSLDYKRANKFLRKKRRAKLPPVIVIQQKRELFALHQGHCYYCFASIESNGDSADFDHFDPISYGGTGDLWNLVLACKQCNHDKWTAPGKAFRDTMFARADTETRLALTALHVRVDAWREEKRAESRAE